MRSIPSSSRSTSARFATSASCRKRSPASRRNNSYRRPRKRSRAELLHHLPDLLGHVLRQPQRLADDLIDLFPGGAIDHQVSFLAGREEIRILEHRLKRGSQGREPFRRRRENGAAPLLVPRSPT